MNTGENRFKNSSMRLFGAIILMACFLLSEFAALIHFNMTDWGWSYWRAGVIVAIIYSSILYISVIDEEVMRLRIVLIGMIAPFVFWAIILAGYIVITWHIPELKDLDFSSLGLIQIYINVLAAVIGFFWAKK